MWLQSVQYDLQHDFAWVTDEADRSVVLSLLQVALGSGMAKDWVGGNGFPMHRRKITCGLTQRESVL